MYLHEVSFLVLQSSWCERERRLLCFDCLPDALCVIALWRFITVPWVCLQCVIVVFPIYAHLLYLTHVSWMALPCAVPERRGDRGPGPTWKIAKYRVPCQYWYGFPEKSQATKPAINVGPPSARSWPAYRGIWILSSTKNKYVIKVGPPDKTLDPRMNFPLLSVRPVLFRFKICWERPVILWSALFAYAPQTGRKAYMGNDNLNQPINYLVVNELLS